MLLSKWVKFYELSKMMRNMKTKMSESNTNNDLKELDIGPNLKNLDA